MLPEKEKGCADALTLKQAAEVGLNEARTRQTAEAGVLKKVRELDARLGEQKKQVEDKVKAIGEAERQGRGYQSNIEQAGRALKQAQTGLDAIRDYQAGHAADALLLTNLAVIAREFTSLRDSEAKHDRACAELAAADGKKASSLAACGKLEADHEKSRREFEKRQTELGRLADELAAILRGRDLSLWRDEADALKERERLLLQADEIIDRIEKAGGTLEGLKTVLKAFQVVQGKLLG